MSMHVYKFLDVAEHFSYMSNNSQRFYTCLHKSDIPVHVEAYKLQDICKNYKQTVC